MHNTVDAALSRFPLGARLKRQEDTIISKMLAEYGKINELTGIRLCAMLGEIAALRKLAASLESDAREATETRFKEIGSGR